jgi:pilus assembly protein Flp/PilA
MRRTLRKLLRSERGQGMSEYLIIVALIAVAAIGVVTVFGKDIRELFAASTGALAGDSTKNEAKAATAGEKTLKNFGENK